MRRRIPSTGALVAFEAAARHESFTKAAADLALTQSAVCRQIAGLEAYLGVALFRRTRHGVKLTEAGEGFSRQVASRLDAIEQDTLGIMASHGRGATLQLAVVPTFATQWLLPRLPHFMRAHPDITVNLTTRTRPFLFEETTFDAAIQFGEGSWPGTDARHLMREHAVPVCSPALLRRISRSGKPVTPQEVVRLPLLQQETRPYAWRNWCESAGVDGGNPLAGPRFELFSMLAQAARHDMGVALIPAMLIEEDLAGGRLVVACAHSHRSAHAYHIVFPERKAESAALRLFIDWLCLQAQSYRAAAGLE
ncbi:MAG TPA: LysR family transcriptional regulator [Noviherbaspirillum sp.]|jgi:LysR family glycine cleavage system transcriptional activator|uniref:LysR family transcriptional regulator n=1 Tax=Noviherbaspirillum sp. TaxID=1926288 RepID=UPI002F93F5F5